MDGTCHICYHNFSINEQRRRLLTDIGVKVQTTAEILVTIPASNSLKTCLLDKHWGIKLNHDK